MKLVQLDILQRADDRAHFVARDGECARWHLADLGQLREAPRRMRGAPVKHHLILDQFADTRAKVILVAEDDLHERRVLTHLQQRIEERQRGAVKRKLLRLSTCGGRGETERA